MINETDSKRINTALTGVEHQILIQLLKAAIEQNVENLTRLELLDLTEFVCTCGKCEKDDAQKMKEAHQKLIEGAKRGVENLKSVYAKLK